MPDTRLLRARLLARLHRELADFQLPPRPTPTLVEVGLDGRPTDDGPALLDPDLDRWLADFHRRTRVRHPLHGDFYAGNTRARHGRVRRFS